VVDNAPKRASASTSDTIILASPDEHARASIGRRGFLRLAAGGVAGSAVWLGAGCFGDDDDPPQSTPAASTPNATPEVTPTPADTPRRGGTLRMGQGADLSLAAGHPFAIVSQNRILSYAAHETLIQYVGSLNPQLLLADRFEVTPDFQRVIVTLKPELEFHNGAPVTADDVAFSVEAVRNPASAGLTAAPLELVGFARAVTDIKVTDPRTVEFTLDQPRANIADFFAQLHIAHRDSFAGMAQGDVVGTGPFRLASWDEGRAYRLERFDKWHGATPYLDAIEVVIYTPDAAVIAFRGGNLDAYLAVSAPNAAQLDDKLTRVAGKTGMNYLGVNVSNPLLQDARVRQAIFYALDRDRLLKDAGQGFGSVTTQPWAATSPAFDPTREAALFDASKATALLSQAGFQQDRELVIEYAATSALQELQAQLIQVNLQAIGMEIRIQGVDVAQYQPRYRAGEFPDFWLAGHIAGDLTPLSLFQQTLEFRPAGNVSHFDDATYTALVARLEAVDAKSAEALDIYGQLNRIMLENPFVIPTGIPQARIDIVQENIGGWPEKPEDYAIAVTGKVDFSKVWIR
jgi:peptide/nickel transport system substrate-binding protein